MATTAWEKLARLPLRVEGHELIRHEQAVSGGFIRAV